MCECCGGDCKLCSGDNDEIMPIPLHNLSLDLMELHRQEVEWYKKISGCSNDLKKVKDDN